MPKIRSATIHAKTHRARKGIPRSQSSIGTPSARCGPFKSRISARITARISRILGFRIAADLKEGKSEVVCEAGKLIKVSKDKLGIITRDVLTKKWTDWVDYWAVDFDYENRKEIIKVAKTMGVEGGLPSVVMAGEELLEFEERWTGGYIFENEWQSFRTCQNRDLELTSVPHTHPKPGRYTVAAKVIDIFGNDTMTLVPVNVG